MNAQSPRSRPRRARLPLPAVLAIAVGAAFLVGVLLFAAAYLARRPAAQPEAGPALPERSGRTAVPALPTPQPAAERPAVDAPWQAPASDPVAPDAAPAMPAAVDPALPEAWEAAPETIPPAVGGATRAPVAVRTPEPSFPRSAMRRGESGEVILAVRVDRDGRPRDVQVDRSSGYPALDRAAASAVRRWRFEPALEGGVAVEAEVRIPVEFVAGGARR
ncbi:TonB family protein [Luteimonas sp. Y-2-2-4F]|nr:energy transducer TonB [Luteimonas sp. Y-2-2-4F]MCD9032042.1 TonB family protein [Luteimonas sp. Y-2-2-4F]